MACWIYNLSIIAQGLVGGVEGFEIGEWRLCRFANTISLLQSLF
jgi:hypothetical protein